MLVHETGPERALVVYKPRVKSVIQCTLVLAVVFVVIGIYVDSTVISSDRDPVSLVVYGAICLVVAIGAGAFLYQEIARMSNQAPVMRVTADGVIIMEVSGRASFIAWGEIKKFVHHYVNFHNTGMSIIGCSKESFVVAPKATRPAVKGDSVKVNRMDLPIPTKRLLKEMLAYRPPTVLSPPGR